MRRARAAVLIAGTLAVSVIPGPVAAQDPLLAPPVQEPIVLPERRALSGSAGFGLSLSSGNSDTINYNVSWDFVHDPRSRNVVKGSGLYLRGKQNDELTVNRTSVAFRDEFTIENRLFAFAQLDYIRDTFKRIEYLIAPTGGIGYRVVETPRTRFAVDGSIGSVWEKNPDQLVHPSAAINLSEVLEHQLTGTTTLKHSTTVLLRADDFGDGLYTFSAGLAARITDRFQLTVDLLDTFKQRPPTAATTRNDVVFVTAITASY